MFEETALPKGTKFVEPELPKEPEEPKVPDQPDPQFAALNKRKDLAILMAETLKAERLAQEEEGLRDLPNILAERELAVVAKEESLSAREIVCNESLEKANQMVEETNSYQISLNEQGTELEKQIRSVTQMKSSILPIFKKTQNYQYKLTTASEYLSKLHQIMGSRRRQIDLPGTRDNMLEMLGYLVQLSEKEIPEIPEEVKRAAELALNREYSYPREEL